MHDASPIEHERRAEPRWTIAWRFIRWSAGAVVLLVLAFFFLPWFSSTSICDQCGCRCNDQSVAFLNFHSEEQTPLGELIDDWGLVGPHSHHWIFIAGGGSSVVCALGSGRTSDGLAQSDHFIQFLRDTERFRGRAEAHAWIKAALDSERAKSVREWVFWWDVSKGDIRSKAEYDEWWKLRDRVCTQDRPELVRTKLLRMP